jgi:cytochrome c biogenesis protein
VRKVDLATTLQDHLGSGAKSRTKKELRNVGPSVTYKLRDAAGQAREFHNYMLPVELDGRRVFLAGVRDTPAEPFRYLRIPADDEGSWPPGSALRRALTTRQQREPRRCAATWRRPHRPTGPTWRSSWPPRPRAPWRCSPAPRRRPRTRRPTRRGRAAGAGAVHRDQRARGRARARISEVLLRILNGSPVRAGQPGAREGAGQAAGPRRDHAGFMTQAVLALSDANFYPAPLLFQLADFKQVQASVFQVARAPGKNMVYLGACC